MNDSANLRGVEFADGSIFPAGTRGIIYRQPGANRTRERKLGSTGYRQDLVL